MTRRLSIRSFLDQFPQIATPILFVLVLEWLVWLFIKYFLRNVPHCPLCGNSFSWIETERNGPHGARWRPLSFPCPRCGQIIGVPSWRKPFLWVSYLGVIAVFFYFLFDMPGDLFWGFVGILVAAFGALRIADWFIWRHLQPGRPN